MVLDSIPARGKSMKFIRIALAFPFYCVAFAFHLLCAAFTVIAHKVAGDELGPTGRMEKVSLAVLFCAAVSAMPVWVLSRTVPELPTYRLLPQAPMDYWRDVPPGFLPEQLVWVKPLIRLTACIFAERAVRQNLVPAKVGFEPCGDGGKVQATIAENFTDATVSGVATVDGIMRHYNVSLQHYPPSVDEWGFIATGIEIEDEH